MNVGGKAMKKVRKVQHSTVCKGAEVLFVCLWALITHSTLPQSARRLTLFMPPWSGTVHLLALGNIQH